MTTFNADVNINTAPATSGLNDLKAAADAAKRAADEFKRSVGDTVGQVRTATSMIGNLARAFNAPGVGLAAGMVDAVAAGAQMGAAFGPGGVVIGGFTALVTQITNANTQLRTLIDNVNELSRAAHAASTDVSYMIENIGDFSDEEVHNAMVDLREDIEALTARKIELEATANNVFGDLTTRMEAAAAASRIEDELLVLTSRMSDLSDVANEAGTNINNALGLGLTAPSMPTAPTAPTPTTRRGGGTREPVDTETQQVGFGGTAPQLGESAELMLQTSRTEAELAEATIANLRREAEERAAVTESMEAQNAAARELAATNNAAYEEAAENLASFREGWGGGISELAEAFEEADRAAKTAGAHVSTNAERMGAALESVGETATEQIGTGMAEAFAAAIAAAVTGGEEFDKVMLKMTQALLSNILQQAIVQGIMQLALAISDAASENWKGFAMHMAGFGAWTAVAAAAGGALAGVSAAAGSGGGGGGASAGAKASDSASRREGGNDEEGGRTINVYYSNPLFSTSDEQARMIEQSLRRGGLWPDRNRA